MITDKHMHNLKQTTSICVGILFSFFGTADSQSQVPGTIHYQARIAEDGQALGGGVTMGLAFQLLAPTTEQILWRSYPVDVGDPTVGGGFAAENLLSYPVSNGQVSVTLGSGGATNLNEPIPLEPVFVEPVSGAARAGVKLRVWMAVDGGEVVKLEPDIQFASVPYAMVAGRAESVRNRSVDENQIVEGAVTASLLAPDSVTSTQIQTGAVGGDEIADGVVTEIELSSELNERLNLGLVPPGTIVPFGGDNVPPGWELCDGQAMDKDANGGKYQPLYDAIGTAWGNGMQGAGAAAGVTEFNLPDLRGHFLRGNDRGTGRDSDRAARIRLFTGGNAGNSASWTGSYQYDAFQGHWHDIAHGSSFGGTKEVPATADTNNRNVNDTGGAIEAHMSFTATSIRPDLINSHGSPRVSSETRPKNAYVNYIIKY